MNHILNQSIVVVGCIGLCLGTLSTPEVEACQPPPTEVHIVSTLPADGTKTGIDDASGLGLTTPIAIRWSTRDAPASPLSTFEFYYFEPFRELDPDEQIVSSFELFAEGTDIPHPGRLVISSAEHEARFVPSSSLQANTRYTATVQFIEGQSYSWNFLTTSETSHQEMPPFFGGITSLTLREKAVPRYTYCEPDFSDPNVIPCGPYPRYQSGWEYPPRLHLSFDAIDSSFYGPELYRYAIYIHDSTRDVPGRLLRYVDVRESGPQEVVFGTPSRSDTFCYSMHYYYTYEKLDLFEQTAIECVSTQDLITIDRLPDPDVEPLDCWGDTTPPDMGGDSNGPRDMSNTGGGNTGGGWNLSEVEEDPVDDDGCGCASSPGKTPDTGGLLLLGLGLCAGVIRRRRS